jgi:hypothetical protein
MARISRRISSGVCGLPPGDRDFQRQNRRKAGAVPTKDGLRIDNRQNGQNMGRNPIEAGEYQTVKIAE